jgi:hypothetical protein
MNRPDWPASQLYPTSTWLGPGALPWPLWPRFSDSQASLGTDSSHSHKRGALSGSKQVLRASGILLPRVAADDSP